MLFSFLIKTCGKRVTLIEWKKRRRLMTKLSKGSNPVFLKTIRNLIHGELSLLPRLFVFATVSHRGERETRVTGDEAQGTSGEPLYQVTQLSVTLLNRANSCTRSQKTPAVSWFGHLDFTREEPGMVQKGIELWDSFGENTAFIVYRKRLARLPSLVWVVDDVLNSAPVISLAFYRNKNTVKFRK